jgi:hypothetical protein
MAEKLNEVVSFFLNNTSFDKKSLIICLASITFNPTAWNFVARNGECKLSRREDLYLISLLLDRIPEQNYHSIIQQ